jgi:hypothetical protein
LTDELLREISGKLDKLIRLEALAVVRNESSEQDKIGLLDSLGFRPIEIAKMLNKTPENVGMVLTKLRRKAKPKGEPSTSPLDQPQPGQTKQDLQPSEPGGE